MSNDPREHINKIRGDFHASQRIKDSLNNSIQTLSKDLYTKDTHFILELIQNAEDNKYIQSEPSLSFQLVKTDPTNTKNSDGALIIKNNEIGFSLKNVDAICAVGKTTKSKIQGYIGEKGIGFKSVFRVTTNPYIFSNGYCFCLPEHDEETGLGFIVPRWVDKVPEGIDLSQTTIILPLSKPGFGYEQIEEMLREIEPESILFLSKLKEIQIKTDTGDSLTILKDDSKAPLVQILVEGNRIHEAFSYVDEFLFYNRNFTKPEYVDLEKRKDIDNRDVSIAFPLNNEKDHSGNIFAYLPVRSDTGLPFMINADFLLTSSREAIQEDELWNQWLRDCVPDVFIEAFEAWLDLLKYRTRIYRFIPLESHIEFLEPIVECIQSEMKNRKIILTEPDGMKYKSDQTRTASKRFRSLLSKSSYPETLLDTRLVLNELEKYQEHLKKIGVKLISLELVKMSFQEREWIEQHDHDWLLDCYRYLKGQTFEKTLTDCPIVPIDEGGESKYSCDNEQPIYFECDDECEQILNDIPSCARVNLAFMRKEFYEKLQVDEELLKWTNETLRVFDFSATNHAVDVLSWFKDHYEEISEPDFLSITDFLLYFENTNIDFKNIPILLANSRRILLSEALTHPNIQAVVTPVALDPIAGWQNVFVSEEDRDHLQILSNQYINENINYLDILSWFQRKLKITDAPLPFRDSLGNYKSLSLLEGDSTSINESFSQSMVSLLNKLGNISWSSYQTSYTYRRRRHYEDHKTDFLIALQEKYWLPTTKGPVRPKQAFLHIQQIKEVLGDSVPYFTGDILDNIIEVLGVRNTVSNEELISVLGQHSENGDGSRELAERIYRTLDSRDLPPDIIKKLRTGKMIYAPINNQSSWVTCNDVIWKDRKDVFGDDIIYLETFYPRLKDFFIGTLGIKEDVDTEVFARRWLQLQKESNKTSDEIQSTLIQIYREIRAICEMDYDNRPDWWLEFVHNAKIWTQDKVFAEPDLVYIPDDGDLRRIFQGANLSYAWRPEKDTFLDWEALFRAFDIKYLSESVSITLGEKLDYKIKTKNDYLTNSAKILISTWIREIRPNDYNRLLNEGIVNTFLNTSEGTGSTWEVIYHLGDREAHKERDVVWYEEESILLVTEGGDGRKKNHVALTLAMDLMPNRTYKDLSDWIELVLGENDWKWRIKQKGWHIPDEVKEWAEGKNDDLSKDLSVLKVDESTNLDSSQRNKITIQDNEIGGDSPETPLAQSNKLLAEEKVSEQKATKKTVDKPITYPLGSEQDEHGFNYEDEFSSAFNRSGKVTIDDRIEADPGLVSNIERRTEKEAERHQERIENEPDPHKRRKRTEHTIIEGPDEQVRKTLEEWYQGKCQICGDTFPERDGKPFFIANYIVPRKFARQVDTYANALCLCAGHFAKWQHGTREADNIVDQIKSMKTKAEGGPEDLRVRIKLCGEECFIRFNEKHLISLQALLFVDESNP